jgi:hypothetical protein
VAAPARPDGVVARRRAAYHAAVASGGDLRTRLDLTDLFGMPTNAG